MNHLKSPFRLHCTISYYRNLFNSKQKTPIKHNTPPTLEIHSHITSMSVLRRCYSSIANLTHPRIMLHYQYVTDTLHHRKIKALPAIPVTYTHPPASTYHVHIQTIVPQPRHTFP
jgi:hypothetical protein